jgi:non-ribosomal peptide synthetase component F
MCCIAAVVLLLLLCCCCQADGHCLYRSLEDQLEQTAAAAAAAAGNISSEQQQLNYQELRELAAEYIREHKCVQNRPWLDRFSVRHHKVP